MTLDTIQAGCRIANQQQILKVILREGRFHLPQLFCRNSFANQGEFDEFLRMNNLEFETDPVDGVHLSRDLSGKDLKVTA